MGSPELLGHATEHAELKTLLQEGRLSHGYLLAGPARIGKRLFALAFARELEFGEFSPSGEPPASDLKLIKPVAGTIGIDAIREMQQFLFEKPFRSPRKTLIVNDAEQLTDEAQNALLKIAEEPPQSALIFLIVSDPERLRPTVQSRFQKLFFSPLAVKEVESWLRKELDVPAAEAKKIAARTEGRPGLAYAFLRDPKFREGIGRAEEFLASGASGRKELIKELAEDEDFDLPEFLDLLVFAGRDRIAEHPRFWQRVLALRRESATYNMNPRLQLTALSEILL